MTRKMLAVYRGYINNYILPELADWRLAQLTKNANAIANVRLCNAGTTVPTMRKVASLHNVLEYAISQDWIDAPLRGFNSRKGE